MTSVFAAKKAKILSQLHPPSEEYTDASPKGSVDAPVQALVHEINRIDSLVTTSSCSGRIAIYAEGRKNSALENASSNSSSGQGKGGGSWLFVSHSPLDLSDTHNNSLDSLVTSSQNEGHVSISANVHITTNLESLVPQGARLVHLKFEPLILHILCSSLSAARKVLIAGQGAGFRESGISSVPEPAQLFTPVLDKDDAKRVNDHVDDAVTGQWKEAQREYPKRQRKPQKQTQDGPVMVAIRTMGLGMDAPIGYMSDTGDIISNVSDAYIQSILRVANERFVNNEERKQRLSEGINKAFGMDS